MQSAMTREKGSYLVKRQCCHSGHPNCVFCAGAGPQQIVHVERVSKCYADYVASQFKTLKARVSAMS